MKKMILSWLLIGSSCMVFAQNETGDTTRPKTNTYDSTRMSDSVNQNMNNVNNMNNDSLKKPMNTNNPNANANNNMSSTNQSNAYANMPTRIQMNLQKDYPAANNITWTQSGEWYQGTYGTGGRYTRIYYNQRGDTYSVALPVTQTYVPDDIVGKVGSMFGPTIYDITMLKQDSTHNIYQVRTAENGVVKAQWIAEDGSSVADPFRSDVTTETNTSTNAAMGNQTDSTGNMNNMNTNKTGMDSTGNWNNKMNTDSTKKDMSTDSTSNMNSSMSTENPTTTTTDSTGADTKTKMKAKTKTEPKKEY